MLAKLRGVPLCGQAQADAGACAIESRVGTATVGAGPGSNPYYINGPVALTGPYKGAPYGLSVAVRAVAGPFDLGTVVVRAAIYVDPSDGHLTVVSDPLPIVVKGVPVRLRTVNVKVDRPGFTITPTSCAEKQIVATFTSTQGAISRSSARYVAASCSRLDFTPKLSLALTGRGQTTDGKHPGLKATVTRPAHDQAGFKSFKVALPLSLALDPENAASDTLCEFEEGQKPDPQCPKSSIIGRAKAVSPLLNRPLAGNVYFVKNVRIDKRTGRRDPHASDAADGAEGRGCAQRAHHHLDLQEQAGVEPLGAARRAGHPVRALAQGRQARDPGRQWQRLQTQPHCSHHHHRPKQEGRSSPYHRHRHPLQRLSPLPERASVLLRGRRDSDPRPPA